MKILVIGGSSVIGSKIIEDKTNIKHFDMKFTYLNNKLDFMKGERLDITKKQNTIELIKKNNPNVIIHCVALTNVDKCETEKENAYNINVNGIENVVAGAKIINSKIVYISTSAVFDGQKTKYFEYDKTCPISYYGETKVTAEKIIQDSTLPYLILRTDQPYCQIKKWQHTNSVLRIVETLKNNRIHKEVKNWYNRPTFVPNFVHALRKLLENNEEGIFHTVDNSFLNRVDMAMQIAEIFKFNKEMIKPINSEELKLDAKRANVNLNNEKLFKKTGFKMSSFREGIKEMFFHQD